MPGASFSQDALESEDGETVGCVVAAQSVDPHQIALCDVLRRRESVFGDFIVVRGDHAACDPVDELFGGRIPSQRVKPLVPNERGTDHDDRRKVCARISLSAFSSSACNVSTKMTPLCSGGRGRSNSASVCGSSGRTIAVCVGRSVAFTMCATSRHGSSSGRVDAPPSARNSVLGQFECDATKK